LTSFRPRLKTNLKPGAPPWDERLARLPGPFSHFARRIRRGGALSLFEACIAQVKKFPPKVSEEHLHLVPLDQL
jgi:hypothetical protein